MRTPRERDWNRFWQKTSPPAKGVSWSKRRIIAVLEPWLEGRQTALDAGCGSGFFAAYFCNAGLRTTAIDFAQDSVALARRRTADRATVLRDDLLSADLPQRIIHRFDVIFTDGLFEHFPPGQQDRIMQNLIALLSGDGLVITFVPNRWSPWELIRPLYMPGIDEQPFVFSQLLALNARNGLNIIESGGINVVPLRWSPDRSLGRYFGMLLYTVARRQETGIKNIASDE